MERKVLRGGGGGGQKNRTTYDEKKTKATKKGNKNQNVKSEILHKKALYEQNSLGKKKLKETTFQTINAGREIQKKKKIKDSHQEHIEEYRIGRIPETSRTGSG